jgi:hypothetical protein
MHPRQRPGVPELPRALRMLNCVGFSTSPSRGFPHLASLFRGILALRPQDLGQVGPSYLWCDHSAHHAAAYPRLCS